MKKLCLIGLLAIAAQSVSFAQWSLPGPVGAGNIYTNGNVGIGTSTPRGPLDVARPGDIWLTNNGLNSSHSIIMPGHAYFTPFNGTDDVYIQARRINDTGSTKLILRTWNSGSHVDAMVINNSGNVGIGTTDTKGYKLGVNGSAIATSMTVKLNANWPDFVFAKSYGLRPLAEVESYIQAHAHLPEVPSAAQVAKDGINLGEMDAPLLKENEAQSKQLETQNKQIEGLQKQLAEDKK
jgi:hypothetical protein